MHAVLEENTSVNIHEVPEATLRRYIREQKNDEEMSIGAGRHRRTFSKIQEEELAPKLH